MPPVKVVLLVLLRHCWLMKTFRLPLQPPDVAPPETMAKFMIWLLARPETSVVGVPFMITSV